MNRITLDRLEAVTRVDRQFLRDVRDYMKCVVAHGLADEALRLCTLIRAHDLYIAAPPPPVDYGKEITLKFDAHCQGTKCGQAIPRGHPVIWVHGEGCWHPQCWRDEQDQKPEHERLVVRA